MLFGIIVLALIAGVAFFHYIQGAFSALISAVIAILAAVIAVSYHEQVAAALLGSAMPNYAHATALVGLFAFAYLLPRLVADKAVSGNVRLPLMVEKIGAGVLGLVAGIFAAGIFALGGQMLPVGPSLAGYCRFDLADREVSNLKVGSRSQRQDLTAWGEMKDESIDTSKASGLFPIPADEIVLNVAAYLSNDGSLAGDSVLRSVHPSYQDELFGQRVGPYKGGDVVIDSDGRGMAVSAVYDGKNFLNSSEDFELKEIRGSNVPTVMASDDVVPVVIRTNLATAFNPASVRVVVAGKDYFPVGVIQRGEQMLRTRPDDVLFPVAGKSIDLVFLIDANSLPAKDGAQHQFPEDAIIEAHRGLRSSLAGKDVSEGVPDNSGSVGVLEKDRNSQR